MTQRTVLVTGGNRGLGLGTVTSLAEKGYTVILGCRSRAAGE